VTASEQPFAAPNRTPDYGINQNQKSDPVKPFEAYRRVRFNNIDDISNCRSGSENQTYYNTLDWTGMLAQ